MIFGEGMLKDAYRRVVWGPGRQILESTPPTVESRVVRGLGRSVGALAPDRVVRKNLERAFPGRRGLDQVARDAHAAHFSNQYASFSFGKCTRANWSRYLRFEGLEHLSRAHALGRGVVLTHPHMGPAQLPLHVLGLLGWPMHQVGGGEVAKVELSPTGRWAADTRAALERRMPVELHDGKAFLRPVMRALQDGAVVMTACDATGGGHELGKRLTHEVLGQPMRLPVGPAWLAWKTGAPLLTVHCWRGPGQVPAFTATIGAPIDFARDQGKDAALLSATAGLARYLDRVLREHPGDWLFWDGFTPGELLEETP